MKAKEQIKQLFAMAEQNEVIQASERVDFTMVRLKGNAPLLQAECYRLTDVGEWSRWTGYRYTIFNDQVSCRAV